MYKFDGVPAHVVLVRLHGNAKSNQPYRRTRESTKTKIKEELEHSDPKDAVNEVFVVLFQHKVLKSYHVG